MPNFWLVQRKSAIWEIPPTTRQDGKTASQPVHDEYKVHDGRHQHLSVPVGSPQSHPLPLEGHGPNPEAGGHVWQRGPVGLKIGTI